MSTAVACFAPVVAATGETVKLAMQRLWLTGQVLPAGARLTVQHVFRSEEEQPLEVIYSFPLPRDAALRKFRITGEGFEAYSELKETEAAVKAYEEGVAQGSLSTLARQHGDGVINLTVGNIRPKETVTVYLDIVAGVELRDDGFRFRFPFTLAPAYHPRAKAAVVAPGEGEMELPAAEFGDVILPRFREDASALHQVGFDLSVRSNLDVDEMGSPSHTVRVKRESGGSRVALAAEKDVPNRDLVLDAHYSQTAPQILAGRDKNGKGRFAAIIPSTSFGANQEAPRRVVILLDRSGSMGGSPIEQAKKAIEACLGALSDRDYFGLVAFDDQTESFEPRMQQGSRENRDNARAFLRNVHARGGTELAQGFRKAVELLAGQGGDVLIMTDGQVAGTEEILSEARATKTRLHCLGIGSASQDRFLALLARETGGVSRFVTPSERVDMSAVDLFASIGRPVVSGLKAEGNVQPAAPDAVFSGTPVLLFGESEAAESDRIGLTWDGGGSLSLPVSFAGSEIGETVWLLQGARLITDWESRYPAAEALASLDKRKQGRVAARLRDLSQTYGLASREMSLVAVVKRAGDRPGELPETRVVPVGMAQDTGFNAYFGAPAKTAAPIMSASMFPTGGMAAPFPPMAPPPPPSPMQMPAPVSKPRSLRESIQHKLDRVRAPRVQAEYDAFKSAESAAAPPPPPPADDQLLDLASAMDSDGGMPGKTPDERAEATVIALFAFLSNGHTASSGAFRTHVSRLMRFLESLKGLSPGHAQLVATVIASAKKGQAPQANWLAMAKSSDRWKDLSSAIGNKSIRV